MYHGNMAESQWWLWRSSHTVPYFKVRKQRLRRQKWFSLSHMVLGECGKFRGGVGVMRRWGYLRKHSLTETSTIIVVYSTTGKADPILIKGNCLN